MEKKLFLAILLAATLGLSFLTFQKTNKSQHTWTTKQQRVENFIARQKGERSILFSKCSFCGR